MGSTDDRGGLTPSRRRALALLPIALLLAAPIAASTPGASAAPVCDQSVDADCDGLKDTDEARCGSDPNDPDSDDDTLNDLGECKLFMTNPLSSDTDGDTLTDPDEINKYDTDPTRADTDREGLRDGVEVKETLTDPTDPDTDGDLYADSTEVKGGTDPRNPFSIPFKVGSISPLPPKGPFTDEKPPVREIPGTDEVDPLF